MCFVACVVGVVMGAFSSRLLECRWETQRTATNFAGARHTAPTAPATPVTMRSTTTAGQPRYPKGRRQQRSPTTPDHKRGADTALPGPPGAPKKTRRTTHLLDEIVVGAFAGSLDYDEDEETVPGTTAETTKEIEVVFSAAEVKRAIAGADERNGFGEGLGDNIMNIVMAWDWLVNVSHMGERGNVASLRTVFVEEEEEVKVDWNCPEEFKALNNVPDRTIEGLYLLELPEREGMSPVELVAKWWAHAGCPVAAEAGVQSGEEEMLRAALQSYWLGDLKSAGICTENSEGNIDICGKTIVL